MTDSPAIVVVAYNRPLSLKRLLSSLETAYYPNSSVELVISIDRSDENQEVFDIAEDFDWKFGNKTVKYQPENLGLRKHIIQCGNLTDKYGSIIVLEDDLFVSPNFYNYACSALKFTLDKPFVGGVSLYTHKTNVHTGDYFSALEDGYDNWYFQFASSWGQAWSKEQWNSFMEWYSANNRLEPSEELPEYVSSWSEKSWLKYFIAYLVENEKYFLYPKTSLSTNFNDAGTHVKDDSSIYQSELFHGKKIHYSFSTLEESKAVYDAFYESKYLGNFLKSHYQSSVEIDLYGHKKGLKRYLVTSKQLNFKILNAYSRSLKPVELNIIHDISGDDFWLYDTEQPYSNNFANNDKRLFRRVEYSTKYVNQKWANLLVKEVFLQRLRSKYSQLKKKYLN